MRQAALSPLHWFTPLPPARNGIADYASVLLSRLRDRFDCTVWCDDVLAEAPAGVRVADAAQAWRFLAPGAPILHQIGNNGGHVFVLEALRRHGGIVSLHDLHLLYLYELASPRIEPVLAGMLDPSPALGRVFADHWREHRLKTAANYALFDMTGEILSLADAVIVHSRFALEKLRALRGDEATRHVRVIPHFAIPCAAADPAIIRARLGMDDGERLVLTAGFASKGKRFDWLVPVLDDLLQRGCRFRWVHAGAERPDEFALKRALRERPALNRVTTVTGYVTEAELDSYIGACDVLVNLRFPSVGESSGTLARAFFAGRCCVVNDTAAYAELPRDAVVHVPVLDTCAALSRAIEGLLEDDALRADIGARASRYARTELSLDSVAARYADAVSDVYGAGCEGAVIPVLRPQEGTQTRVLEVSGADAVIAGAGRVLHGVKGPFKVTLWFSTAAELAARSCDCPGLLGAVGGPNAEIRHVRIVGGESGGLGLQLHGVCH